MRALLRNNLVTVLGLALVLALASSTAALAAGKIGSNGIKNNAILSRHIKNGTIHSGDLAKSSVGSAAVKNDSLTGSDVNEGTLGTVPSAVTAGTATTATTAGDAGTVGGRAPASFASSTVYKVESAVGPGTDKGDGTFVISQGCNSGDILLNGGPADLSATSDMVESFPTPGSTNSWTARVNKNGATDNFLVVVLCLDQTP